MMGDESLTAMAGFWKQAIKYWRIGVLLGCCAVFGIPSLAAAQEFQSLASIRKAAVDYALAAAKRAMPEAQLAARATSLDSRLRLPLCHHPLQSSAPSNGRAVGNTVVSVRCSGARPWKLYVPVEVKARLMVLVAAQPLVRGAQVKADMLSAAERDVTQLPYGYFTRQAAVLGQVLQRNLSTGKVLTPGMLRRPLLVRRGQVVTLTAGADGFSVTTQGVALQDGASGALVRVRNSQSKRVVQGVVTGSGQVQVQG